MNTRDHLDAAEGLIAEAQGEDGPGGEGRAVALSLRAVSHLLVVIAAELGAPHDSSPAGGAPSGG
ncbi:MAG TPA: hypothetical protein VGV89_06845 [Thermoplasmata archaeon]|nr:hypothetical protein [Thermoplasmata archaeon]